MKHIILLLSVIIPNTVLVYAYVHIPIPDSKYALDLNLFEDVLDSELCESQMRYIMNNDTELLLNFLDAGVRTPRGILTGNTIDLGNYYQCLGINKQVPNSVVEGKYCMIEIPLNQNIQWPQLPTLPDFPWTELNPKTRRLSGSTIKRLTDYNRIKLGIDTVGDQPINTRTYSATENITLPDIAFRLAVCLPKVCSTQTAVETFINITELGLQYNELFCRLPNDKPWLAGDYVAIAIFSVIGLLTVLSTAYDLHYNVFLKKDPKKVNKLYQSFSVYNNTARLVTYIPVPGALECLDGIRAFAMMWVILGHSFSNQLSSNILANPLDAFKFMTSLSSIWITAGPITVDTFFMLSGLLLVYTTNGKVKPMKLLKNLHLFYLNRILRIWPVLCAMILLQISFLNWIVDGPFWSMNMNLVHNCRVYWWGTLLHIQNIHSPSTMCIPHTWYLAIDMQLHILSPIVLVWVLTGRRRIAWTALVVSLIAILTASSVFNFMRNFPSSPVSPSRPDDLPDYTVYYYINTLTRASPFFVGLIFGYLLSIYRGRNVKLSKITAIFIWTCALAVGCLTVYSPYPTIQLDWDNQVADNMINSFMRPAWGAAVGWLIFACVHGYGGFFCPKKYMCEICSVYKNADEERKKQLTSDYDMHLKNKETVRELKEIEKLNSDPKIKTMACFDLEKVLSIPQSPVGIFHYKIKYPVLKFTIYYILQKQGYCYMCHAQIGNRGVNEIASCLWVFSQSESARGPVNWLLSHRMWKILGRLSYAMYVTHYPLQILTNAMSVTPIFFTVPFSLQKFVIDFTLAVIVSFIITILVDSPCSVLIKHFLGGGVKKPQVSLDPKDQGNDAERNGKLKESAP